MDTRLSILFFAKSKKNKNDNEVTIYLRVTINGQRFEVSTHHYVDRSKWSSEAGRLKGNSEEAKRVNIFLDTIRAKVYTYQREILQNEEPLTAETFKARWSGLADKSHMLCEVFEEHNSKMAQLVDKDYSPATLERYKTSLEHTKSFLKWKYKVEDLAIDKLNYEFVTEYEFWLKSVRKYDNLRTIDHDLKQMYVYSHLWKAKKTYIVAPFLGADAEIRSSGNFHIHDELNGTAKGDISCSWIGVNVVSNNSGQKQLSRMIGHNVLELIMNTI